MTSPSPASPSNGEQAVDPGDILRKEAEAGILPLHGMSLDIKLDTEKARTPIIQHLSAPAYQSPLRHHRRQASQHREVKETLNARSEYTNNDEDGKGEHHINQYIIKDEIGRGSFGAVHLAIDQYGKEFAVKEFSKSRLRKRAQSNILRRPHAARRPDQSAAGIGFNAPLHRHSASEIHNGEGKGNPLYLIKEEIAIMKKLDHPNLVTLIEVLDDPEEDSLYMVLEMCKKGVIMKVGLGEKSDPYEMENCRCWFRDLILGIEYLHAQGVVHRDIKPDNLLLTEDDVLKIVDFGVSEMFEKASDMMTAKSTGSPAFLPPELCVTKHGDVSGKAADIWSMGVSLYCLRFGRIPFERSGVLEIYEAIKNDELQIEPGEDPEFCDLMYKLLEKDPSKRITMFEIRDHPWVTKHGTDPLLSAEENTADLVEPPSESEVNHAITGKMRNLLTMMKAVKKFKGLLDAHKRPSQLSDALGNGVCAFQGFPTVPEVDGQSEPALHKLRSVDLNDHRAVEGVRAAEGVHHGMKHGSPLNSSESQVDSSIIEADDKRAGSLDKGRPFSKPNDVPAPESPSTSRRESPGEKGHAHDPMDEEPLFLGIGAGNDDLLEPPSQILVAESPTAAEFSIYNTAYEEEVARIRAAQGHTATVYLTRRIDNKNKYKADENMVDAPEAVSGTHKGFKLLLDRAREKGEKFPVTNKLANTTSQTFSDIAAKILDSSRSVAAEVNESSEKLSSLLQKAIEKKDEPWEEKEKL